MRFVTHIDPDENGDIAGLSLSFGALVKAPDGLDIFVEEGPGFSQWELRLPTGECVDRRVERT